MTVTMGELHRGQSVGIGCLYGGTAEALDPTMFIRRHRLRSQLPPDSDRFLREDDVGSRFKGGKCRGATAPADDGNVRCI